METRDSVFYASKNFFTNYGIDLEITDGAVQKIADEAAKSARIGARALKAVYGRVIKPFEFDPFSRPRGVPFSQQCTLPACYGLLRYNDAFTDHTMSLYKR